jgi:protein O-GlcNAc transferase
VPTIAEVFSQALQHHQAGNLGQAEHYCQQILHADPRNADTLHLLGVLVCQSGGNLERAAEYFRSALTCRPTFPEAHCNLGNVFLLRGMLEEAVTHYAEALRQRPHYADAYCNLGNVLVRQNKFDEAVHCYRQALQLKPDAAEVCNNLGLALQQQNKGDEAIHWFRHALRLNPRYADAHTNLGNVLFQRDQYIEAVQCYEQAARLLPHSAQASDNLALALNALGQALAKQDKFNDATRCFQVAIRYRPNFPEAYSNLGNALFSQKKLTEAIACYRHAIQLNPAIAQFYDNLGMAVERQHELDEAIGCYRQAVEVDPEFAQAHNHLGCALFRQGRWDLAIACIRQALRVAPEFAEAQSNLLFCLNYDPALGQDELFASHRRWGEMQDSTNCTKREVSGLRHASDDADPHRRLRIGYVSPDFRQHAVARYLEPVLSHHDPRQVEVYCYAEVEDPDAVTARLQQLSHDWRSTCRMTDAELVQLIRDDRIDILVDLAGHSSNHRLAAFTWKPAPVQATWLGYLNTTGLAAVDYRITDEVLDPPCHPSLDTEELFRLPNGMCCFAHPADAPDVTSLPAKSRGYLTFGAVHNLFKLNGGVFDLWSQVLRAVPKAKLLIFRDTLSATAQDYVRRQFAERGIEGDRLELRQQRCTAGYLGVYSEIDVSLDTFPCTGGVTTCESLYMGVPVLSLCGARPMARNSAAILSRVGLGVWVVDTPDRYVARAAQLVHEFDRLADLRAGLRAQMSVTVCDAERFTRHLEDAFRTMWQRWCAERRP